MGLTRLRAEQISDIDYKQAVRVIATTNIVNLTGGTPNTVDGVGLSLRDRVLVKAQDTASENGLYYVTTLGTGSNGTWQRTLDGNETGEIQSGMIVMVTEGDSFKDTQWKLTTNNPIVIGTTPLTFELNTSTNQISNGNSSITIGALGGNANVTIGGTANVAVFTATGLTANNITTDGNLVVGNNLVVNGNLTYVNVTDLNIEDPIISLGRGPNNAPLTVNDGKDRGEQLWYYTSSEQSAFVGYDNSAGKLIAAANVSISNEIVTVNNYGTLVVGTLEGTTVSATANVVGGNITTGGLISATGNVTGNYILGNGSQLTGLPEGYSNANVTSLLAAFGSNTISTTGTVTAGNITGGNILTSGLISATSTITSVANVIGGNITTAGVITATGNIQGGNLRTTGLITATGNIQSGNILTDGLISATSTITSVANITGGNILTAGVVSATSSITSAANITGGNITTSGLVTAIGNITGGNFLTTGLISATSTITSAANITGANLLSSGLASVTGNVTGGNLLFGSGLVSGTGNIYADKIFANIVGNIDAAGSNTQVQFNDVGDLLGASANFTFDKATNLLTVSNGNIVGGNILTAGLISATSTITSSANITGGNVLTGGSISASGNVNGANMIATNLTGTLTTASQTNITLLGTLSSLSVSGNVQGGNLRTVGLISAAGNVQGGNVIASANVEAGNILTGGIVSATGNVTGNYFIGNGSQLTGISSSGGGNLWVVTRSSGTIYVPILSGSLNVVGRTGNISVPINA